MNGSACGPGPNTSSVRPTGCSTGGAERIALDDEYGTGNLAFTLRWRERALRICVHADPAHRGHVVVDDPGWAEHRASAGHLKPVDQEFLEDLAVSLLSVQPTTVEVDDE